MACPATANRDEHTTRLELLCAELSGELGIEPPPCSVWNTRRIIAGAWLGRKTRLKVSRAAMERLDAMALRWVVAHELGHVADADGRRRLQVARRVFGLTLVAVLLATPLVPEPAGHVLLVAMVAYNLTAGIRLRRRMNALPTARRTGAAPPIRTPRDARSPPCASRPGCARSGSSA